MGFLISVGVALGFPAYYGRNWDAFYECFGDLLEVTDGGMGHAVRRAGLVGRKRALHVIDPSRWRAFGRRRARALRTC